MHTKGRIIRHENHKACRVVWVVYVAQSFVSDTTEGPYL
jgi:hypothetical protein